MAEHEKEALLFEKGNPKALAEAVMRIWESYPTVTTITENARIRARKTHDADENYRTLIDIYKTISGDEFL